MSLKINKKIFSWALYDWANSAYATVILAGFFPLFFKEYWSDAANVSQSTFQLGLTNSIASTVIVILAPVLGAIADAGNRKKRLLLVFAGLGILMSSGLYFVMLCLSVFVKKKTTIKYQLLVFHWVIWVVVSCLPLMFI
jgi:MFS-type transporter involved in bile tolerance (Atg22 family)